MTGIQEAGHTATTVLCSRGYCSDECISCASHVWLLTDTTGETLQLPLSHICFTHCLHYQIPKYSGGNFAPADLSIMTV